MIYDSILGTIGRTLIARTQRLAPNRAMMYVKCEFFNPCASVKDRLAIGHHRRRGKEGSVATAADVEATRMQIVRR
jgi:cysteine synthase A